MIMQARNDAKMEVMKKMIIIYGSQSCFDAGCNVALIPGIRVPVK